MSNLEKDPEELIVEPTSAAPVSIEVLEPRDVPLGGPRAMTVRRTLPQRGRSLIGAWCFADHYGPDDVSTTGGMHVPPHPHTGLQTVSWLFAGEIEHRDSTGAHAMVKPGELNLMTAGGGIQHSEVSTQGTTVLHGVQLWTVMPDSHRHGEPFFENYVPPIIDHQGALVSVFLGSLLGQTSAATAFTPIVGAQLDLPANTTITVPVETSFEHGLLVDSGDVVLDGTSVPIASIGYRAPGAAELLITTGAEPARVVLLGGEPFGEQIIMWWNFIGRDHDEVVQYRETWMADVIADTTTEGQFGHVDGYEGRALPAPVLPLGRLRPRD
ncbi:MAG TPA: pirin family protein [Terrimesophilobacter sp.]|nr:pirin family protein [Terrimesophilobacter sp.]HRQ00176.1 pirin family protein [Terrimesophilobacter sp.]